MKSWKSAGTKRSKLNNLTVALHLQRNFHKKINMKKIYAVSILALLAMACNNPAQNKDTATQHQHDTAMMNSKPADTTPVYTAAMLDSKKDLVCGMPVTAGVSDTAHYKGKAYGFCAKECKDEFLKAPEQYLTAK